MDIHNPDKAGNIKKTSMLLVITVLLMSCSRIEHNTKKDVHIKDTKSLDILMGQFANNIENLWKLNRVLIAGPKDYVKYADLYKTRSHINFETGTILVETIVVENQISHLRQAIIKTLLMSNNPNKSIDLYSDTEDISSINNKAFLKEPLLYGQVLDNNGEPIRWHWHAARFADYLLQTSLQIHTSDCHQIWSIVIQLTSNHVDKRAYKYLSLVRKASQRYGIDQSLILAIIQTESSFNPYAVSHSDALGLMQVVQHSAGYDVFKMKGKLGKPSRSYLFNPENNIDIGTAYLAMLQDCYLSGIINPTSRRYAVITAYNGGAGSVLRVFSRDPTKALQIINNMKPDDVYQMLYTNHPSAESRRYLYKVNSLHKNYQH